MTSGAGRAGESLLKDNLLANSPTHYLDTRHFSKKKKSIKRDNKLLQIMPKITKEEKAKHLANFALDVVDKCTAKIN